jgi:NAD/NADP transhydrogenase alpha subunit
MALSAFARLIPFLVIIIAALAIYQFYTAVMFAAQSMYAFALFNAVFGFAGIVLARALWVHRKSFRPPAA